MSAIQTQNYKVVHCPLNKGVVETSHCDNCQFKEESKDENVVMCQYKDIPKMHSVHVTEFTWGDKTYKARKLTKEEMQDCDDYDCCEKCCFHKEMPNGKDTYCALRCGIDTDNEDNSFMCYEGEIWEQRD